MKTAVPQALRTTTTDCARARKVKSIFTLARQYLPVGCRSRVADCVARVRVLSHGCVASRGGREGGPRAFFVPAFRLAVAPRDRRRLRFGDEQAPRGLRRFGVR